MAYTKGVIVIIIFAWIIVRVKMEFSICRTARSERKGVRCAFSIRIDTEGMPFEAIFCHQGFGNTLSRKHYFRLIHRQWHINMHEISKMILRIRQMNAK